MKVFLTGVSGFLGSHIAEELIKSGYQVKALVRKTSKIGHLKSFPLELVEGSLPQTKNLETALEDCDAVIHSAGLVKASSEKEFFQINEEGTKCLADAILKCKNKPKTFIYISTIAVHDSSKDGDNFCLPSSQCHPFTAYGKSKLAGEKALGPLRGKINIQILRPPVLYGPRDKEFFPIFKALQWKLAPLYGSGKNQLSLCYVTDAAKAVVELLKKPESNGIFCVDDGNIYDWRSIVETISKVMNKKAILFSTPPLLYRIAAKISENIAKLRKKPVTFTSDKVREMNQPNLVCGHQKLSQTTGWSPEVKLFKGASQTFDFYRQERWL